MAMVNAGRGRPGSMYGALPPFAQGQDQDQSVNDFRQYLSERPQMIQKAPQEWQDMLGGLQEQALVGRPPVDNGSQRPPIMFDQGGPTRLPPMAPPAGISAMSGGQIRQSAPVMENAPEFDGMLEDLMNKYRSGPQMPPMQGTPKFANPAVQGWGGEQAGQITPFISPQIRQPMPPSSVDSQKEMQALESLLSGGMNPGRQKPGGTRTSLLSERPTKVTPKETGSGNKLSTGRARKNKSRLRGKPGVK